jgi:hypothetical protein
VRNITPKQAHAAYDILVRLAGASDHRDARDEFVYHVAHVYRPATEFRFGGSLGWGGKFRNNGNCNDTPHVTCYREHETPERVAAIVNVNTALAALFGEEPPCP